jgi:hypothetical protein
MDTNLILWAIGFPVLLALLALGVGVGFAMTSSESTGFLVARICFCLAAFDVVAMAIYWALAGDRSLLQSIVIPAVVAIVAIPGLVIALRWLGSLEIQLSTQLYPGNQTLALPFKDDAPPGALKVVIGSNLAWTTKMPQTVLMMRGEKMIEIDKKDGKNQLVISTLRLFDDRDNIIARIDADGFWVENSTRSKRPDPSTLVVYDHSDNEALRIVFLNQTTLSITGIFRHAGVPRPVVVTDDYMDMSGMRLSHNILGPAGRAMMNVGPP